MTDNLMTNFWLMCQCLMVSSYVEDALYGYFEDMLIAP